MAKFCTECGKEIAQSAAFCTECGARAAENTVNANEQDKETKDASEEIITPSAPDAQQETLQEVTPQEVKPQEVKPQEAQVSPAVYTPDPKNKIVGTGTYFGLMLLFAIPIIGFIACIIMSFAPKNKNLKHFARATLIWSIIGLVIGGLIIGGVYMAVNSFMDFLGQLFDGQSGVSGDMFGQTEDIGDLFDQLSELEGLMEQYKNGGLDGLPIE